MEYLTHCIMCGTVILDTLLPGAQPNNSAGPPPTTYSIADVIDAWKLRQDRVKSFIFEWSQQRTYSAGGLGTQSHSKRLPAKPVRLPAETTTYNLSFAFTVQGKSWRFTSDSLITTQDDRILRQKLVSVCDGQQAKTVITSPLKPYPQGYEGGPSPCPEAATTSTCAFAILAYRPFSRGFRAYTIEKLRSFKLTSQSVVVNDRPCLLLQKTSDGNGVRESIWVDRDRNFLPIRFRLNSRDQPFVQVDVLDYARHKTAWVPIKWREMYFRNQGGLSYSGVSEVTKYDINVAAPESDFQMEFPRGTYVLDNRDDPAHYSHYIMLEGRRKRFISDGERGLPYEQLLGTGSGLGLALPIHGATVFLLVPVVVIGLLLLGLLILRGVRRRAASR